jgi:hypothetical protein
MVMKMYLLSLLFLVSTAHSQSMNTTVEKIDTTNLNLKDFATRIVGTSSNNYDRAKSILDWLNKNFEWKYTDYQKRTVKEVLARGGGNCFELATVYMNLIKQLGIRYRAVAEINIQPASERRGQNATERVKAVGNGASVFGKQHNDHRWVEIYDDQSKDWLPADPTTDLIGVDQWMKGRVWFGTRNTVDSNFSKDMLVPIAVFVVSDTNKTVMTENRSRHYLVDAFDALYKGQLHQLPSWKQWVENIDKLSADAKNAFAGKYNFHDDGELINETYRVYLKLKQEYIGKTGGSQ